MKKEKIKSRKKIAVLGHKVVPSRHGGIELVLTTLCPAIVKKGYDVTCYNRYGDKPGREYSSQIKNGTYKGVRLKTVPAIRKRGLSAASASFFASVCAAFGNYDIVHYHAEGPCVMMWIPKLFHKKCIATVHGLDWQRDKWKHSIGKRYIKLGEIVLAHCADEIIVLSKSIKEYFYNEYGRKCIYIPNGIEKKSYKAPNLILRKYGLTKDSYFCSLSRLAEEKGIHYLIKAYQRTDTDKKLVIAGGSSDTDQYVKRLQKMADGNPNIIFTGFVTGDLLEELYSNAYTYILPSNLEGMPITLLEAMAYGNCVIGTDIPEITEVAEDKAVIFPKGNVTALTEKMQMLSDDPELVQKYRKGAADFITEKYSWKKTAEQTLKLYDKLLRQ